MEYAPDSKEAVQRLTARSQSDSYTQHQSKSKSNTQPATESFGGAGEGDPKELVPQLQERLRAQERQIQALETYKQLCEQRILQLCPEHPLPVDATYLEEGRVVTKNG